MVVIGLIFLICYWYRSRKMIPYSLLNYSTEAHQPPMILVDEMDEQLNEFDQEQDMWAQVDDSHITTQQMRDFKKQQQQSKKDISRK